MSKLAFESTTDAKSRKRKVAAATIFGSMLEWYDFYLYATMASIVFSKVFFDTHNPESATLSAFATFAIGFIARPIGGMFFGYFGDKFGRKKMLVYTFSLMGVCTVAIGLIPSYATIGIWAPILLVVFRIVQGLGAGAELAGAAITSYEHADIENRGRQGSWPALGLNLGLLLSSFTVYLLTLGGDEFLLNGGWRIPFILSFFLVLMGLWVRKNLPETPEYHALEFKHQKQSPFKDLFKLHIKGLGVVFFIAIGYNALSYIFKTFSLAYLTQFKSVSANITSFSVTLASLVAVFAVPFFGWLCDRYSSKNMIICGGILSMIFAYPFIAMLNTANPSLIYLAIVIGTGVLAPMMFAPQGSFLSRQFPVETRSTGFATGREIGTAIAGGFAPLWALTLVAQSSSHSANGVIWILAAAGFIVAISAMFDQGFRFSQNKN